MPQVLNNHRDKHHNQQPSKGEVICGGLHSICKDWLISKGIKVLNNQKDAATEVVRKLLGYQNEKGNLQALL